MKSWRKVLALQARGDSVIDLNKLNDEYQESNPLVPLPLSQNYTIYRPTSHHLSPLQNLHITRGSDTTTLKVYLRINKWN